MHCLSTGLAAVAAAAVVSCVAGADQLVGTVQFTNSTPLPMHVVVAEAIPVLFDAAAAISGVVTIDAVSDGPLRIASAGMPIYRIVTGRTPAAFAFWSLAMGGAADTPTSVRQTIAPMPDAPPMDGELYAVIEAIVWPGCTAVIGWDLEVVPQQDG